MRYVVFLLALSALTVLPGCPDKKPKDPTCKSDKDCQDGQVCVNQRCQQCGDDSHCPDGQVCRDGGCVAKPQCSTDDDCPDGKVCQENQCVACASDAQCGPGGRCEQGACIRPKACQVDEDCEDDEDCIDGRCQRPWASTGDDMSCQLASVYFGFDEATVPAEQRDSLNDSAECIRGAPGGKGVYIIGHTDTRGTEEYNIALSERRASVVADYLARLGIDPARFHVIPKGEAEAEGSDDAGMARDRRVDFEWR